MQETQEMQVEALGQKDSLEEGLATHSSILLETPMDRGACQAIVHGLTKLDITKATEHEHLSMLHFGKLDQYIYKINTAEQQKRITTIFVCV